MGKQIVRTDCWEYAVVDVATDSTTVTSKPARLKSITVTTVLSAHALPIMDGAATVFTIPASAAALTRYEFDGIKFKSSLIIDPNDAATGGLLVAWAPL
jgi:hypothetical protein